MKHHQSETASVFVDSADAGKPGVERSSLTRVSDTRALVAGKKLAADNRDNKRRLFDRSQRVSQRPYQSAHNPRADLIAHGGSVQDNSYETRDFRSAEVIYALTVPTIVPNKARR